jgi:hypothetical protein
MCEGNEAGRDRIPNAVDDMERGGKFYVPHTGSVVAGAHKNTSIVI